MDATPLHQSLFELCRQQMAADREFLAGNGLEKVPVVDAALFEDYRLFKLKRTIRHVAENSRFYRHQFAAQGVKPQDIRCLDDLARLPLTSPDQLAADPYAFLCISQSRVERIISFSSSGTLGPKKHISFSEEDISGMTDFMAAGLKTVAGSADVIQILLPEGPVMGQSDLLARGAEKLGAKAVLSGMFRPPEEQIQAIKDHGSTVLFGETHLIYRITKAMESKCDLKGLGVRTVFVTTSYASPVMIDYLKQAWNARVSTHYGLTEMGLGLAVDCPACGAYHFNELDVVAEVVDPTTGRPLPLGSNGELVFTTLQREAMPLVRYRSRDLAVLAGTADSCDSPLRTISHVGKRIESVIELQNGASVFPTRYHDTLFRVPEIIDYDLSLETRDDQDLLVFKIEVAANPEKARQQLDKTIKEDMSNGLIPEAPFEIRLASAESLQQGPVFKKIVQDHRRTDGDGLFDIPEQVEAV